MLYAIARWSRFERWLRAMIALHATNIVNADGKHELASQLVRAL
jgi:hypothetical protein